MASFKPDQDFLTGQLLIAMPNMGDPRFERSVVLVCSHESGHAMGVIVNKLVPDLTIGDLLQQLDLDADGDINASPVFFGGPVQQDHGLIIHTLDYRSDKTLIIADNIGVTGTREILADVAGIDETGAERTLPRPEKFLLALGHAGWSGGQLEEEIQMNAWAHGEADEALVFSGAKQDTWRRALESLGVTGAMLSPEWARPRNSDAPLN